jgi:hypothetical protein
MTLAQFVPFLPEIFLSAGVAFDHCRFSASLRWR